MIGEFLLNIVFGIVTGFFSILPEFTMPALLVDAFDLFGGIIRVACYLLPMDTITVIIGIIIFTTIFRIVISLGKTIWDLLPLV